MDDTRRADASPSRSSLQDSVVAIVDGDEDVADMYALWLAETYEVRTFYSGSSAVEQIDSAVDLVVLDRRLWDRPGGDVVTSLRERRLACPIAIATTVDPGFDVAEMAIDDYLRKPVREHELTASVRRLLAARQYGGPVAELLALVNKRATLLAEESRSVCEHDDRYQSLVQQIHDLAEGVDGLSRGPPLRDPAELLDRLA